MAKSVKTVETPTLEKCPCNIDYWTEYNNIGASKDWVCIKFVEANFVKSPDKVSFSFSTKPSKEAMAIRFRKYIVFEVAFKLCKTELNYKDSDFGLHGELTDFLLQNFKLTNSWKTLYVTMYDRT